MLKNVCTGFMIFVFLLNTNFVAFGAETPNVSNPVLSFTSIFDQNPNKIIFDEDYDNLVDPNGLNILMVNGNFIADGDIVIKDDRTLVPIRVISEEFGVNIKWIKEKNQVVIENNDDIITLTIGSKLATINDDVINLDVAPQIINNRTYVPLRFVAEGLNATIGYCNDNFIYAQGAVPVVWVEQNFDNAKALTAEEAANNTKELLYKCLESQKETVDNYPCPEGFKTSQEYFNSVVESINCKDFAGRYWLVESEGKFYGEGLTTNVFVDKYTGRVFQFLPSGGGGWKISDDFEHADPFIFYFAG